MTTRSSPPLPLPLRVLAAPMVWLERSRGLSRLSLVLVFFLVSLIAGLFLWREARLNVLPAIGHPVDVAAIEGVTIPDEQNAFVLYEEALGQLDPRLPAEVSYLGGLGIEKEWSATGPALRVQLYRARDPLEIWRRGTERPDAWHPGALDPRTDSYEATLRGLEALASLALVEASRLESEGDLAGAWRWYLAALRCSRHLGMNAPWSGRLLGIEILTDAAEGVTSWSVTARTDPSLLRQAQEDLLALNAMTPSNAQTFGFEYVARLRRLDSRSSSVIEARAERDHPSAIRRRLDRFLDNEPRRSRRVLRLLIANWLPECDLPASDRPQPRTSSPEVFWDPRAPRRARLVAPQTLQTAAWASDLGQRDELPSFDVVDRALDDRAVMASLVLTLASERYFHDHESYPASPEDLLGLYLHQLPEGRPTDP